jgi:hypothetical protein
MTTPNDDDMPDRPIVIETEALAQKIATSVCDYLASIGWDYAVVSIARRIDLAEDHACAPGATGLHVNKTKMAPALENEAAALRAVAQQLDDMAAVPKGATVSSYIHDVSDYSGGRRAWPR